MAPVAVEGIRLGYTHQLPIHTGAHIAAAAHIVEQIPELTTSATYDRRQYHHLCAGI